MCPWPCGLAARPKSRWFSSSESFGFRQTWEAENSTLRVITIVLFSTPRGPSEIQLDYSPSCKALKPTVCCEAALCCSRPSSFIFIYSGIHERVVVAGDRRPSSPSTPITAAPSPCPISAASCWSSISGPPGARPACRKLPRSAQFAAAYAERAWWCSASAWTRTRRPTSLPQQVPARFLTARELKIHEDYGTFMYPETYIIDASGKSPEEDRRRRRLAGSLDRFADWTDPELRADTSIRCSRGSARDAGRSVRSRSASAAG